ncbi:MAG TPA: hypothetical protein VFR31_21775, partial [Thermoanaerobaculia bacterium]|nr:hypothetical protein [Thermoanaerobaculia bacterium]
GRRSKFDPNKPSRAREALAKFGIEPPKEKKAAVILPQVIHIGGWRRDGCHVRKRCHVHLDRSTLFERVWSVPVDKLAKEWGLSGRGLAKACSRLKVPVPPRGYWARVAAGQRVHRPKLPILPPGQAEEILISMPEPAALTDSGPLVEALGAVTLPLTSSQPEELDHRLDELEAEGPTGLSWDDVVAQARARFR